MPVDLDLLCTGRDIHTADPHASGDGVTAEVNRRLGRAMDRATIEREYRRNKGDLRPQKRKEPLAWGTPWTDADDAYLRAHRRLLDTELGRHLHRSAASVRWRRAVLGLGKRWTDSDDQYLRKHRTLTDQELGHQFHRSVSSIKNRRSMLGIKKRLSRDPA